MLRLLQRIAVWVWDQWTGLGRRWQILFIGACAVALFGVTMASYRVYEYTEHDNNFCTSCHLMNDAFARFSRSAHAKIECHDCHKATRADQLHQLYATMVQQPREVKKHANVPNDVCATCHVRGDSARWRQISQTAGHRIHLESRDSALRNMKCVRCHGVNLHEFASVDQTCGQAGCHANTHIRLGKMSQVETHCTTCHNFLAEAPGLPVDSLGRPLTPRGQQCLGCHAMQQRMTQLDIGRDPHRGVCGDCHNPHTQTSAREINCTQGSCHATWRSVSFHIGVPHPERCTNCHEPHSWRVDGNNCTRCHQNILREWRRTRTVEAPAADARNPLLHLASLGGDDAILAALQGNRAAPQPTRPSPDPFPRFSHGPHRTERCSACHSSQVRHGALIVRSAADCQNCHHQRPGRENCVQCHAGAAAHATTTGDITITLAGVQRTATHRIRFEHQRHQSVECVRCHTNSQTRAPDGANCSSCHDQHHTANATCTNCHTGPRTIAAHSVDDHANCAQCHGPRTANLPVTRAACLVCHTTQTTHMPGRVCENCHHVTTRGGA